MWLLIVVVLFLFVGETGDGRLTLLLAHRKVGSLGDLRHHYSINLLYSTLFFGDIITTLVIVLITLRSFNFDRA